MCTPFQEACLSLALDPVAFRAGTIKAEWDRFSNSVFRRLIPQPAADTSSFPHTGHICESSFEKHQGSWGGFTLYVFRGGKILEETKRCPVAAYTHSKHLNFCSWVSITQHTNISSMCNIPVELLIKERENSSVNSSKSLSEWQLTWFYTRVNSWRMELTTSYSDDTDGDGPERDSCAWQSFLYSPSPRFKQTQHVPRLSPDVASEIFSTEKYRWPSPLQGSRYLSRTLFFILGLWILRSQWFGENRLIGRWDFDSEKEFLGPAVTPLKSWW